MADAIVSYTGPLISRTAALAQGLKRYFTGIACIHHHVSERYASGTCVACAELKRWAAIGKTPSQARQDIAERKARAVRGTGHMPIAPDGAKYIAMSHGCFVLVDEADYDYLSRFKWFPQIHKSGRVYASRNGLKSLGEAKRALAMHRQILGLSAGDSRKVDHENGNGLGNRRLNIRPCGHSQNLFNRGKTRANRSGYKGVYKNKSGYVASIKANGKKAHIGSFNTQVEAAQAYDKTAIELHGTFARLNFPPKAGPV